MTKWLDWLISGACVALVLMGQYQLVFKGDFSPLPLAAGVALLVCVRSVHHHVPRYIAAKYRRKS
jgi:hypothetical protein